MISPDLRARIPIAIVYVLLVASSLVYGSVFPPVLFFVFMICCVQEYFRCSQPVPQKTSYGILLTGSILIYGLFIFKTGEKLFIPALVLIWMAWLLNMAVLFVQGKTLFFGRWTLFYSWVYVSLPFALIGHWLFEHPSRSLIVLSVFIIIWLNDTGAYFVGKALGKHPLASRISPSKTWEGFFGGILFAVLTGSALRRILDCGSVKEWLILSLSIALAAVIGDLTESSWKRQLGIKDSGSSLRGHGGFMDRLDSFIYAIPVLIILYELHLISI